MRLLHACSSDMQSPCPTGCTDILCGANGYLLYCGSGTMCSPIPSPSTGHQRAGCITPESKTSGTVIRKLAWQRMSAVALRPSWNQPSVHKRHVPHSHGLKQALRDDTVDRECHCHIVSVVEHRADGDRRCWSSPRRHLIHWSTPDGYITRDRTTRRFTSGRCESFPPLQPSVSKRMGLSLMCTHMCVHTHPRLRVHMSQQS